MYSNHLHYLPAQILLYLLAGGLLLVLVTLLEIGILNSAYRRLGLPPRAAMLVLLASLVGSYLNIPVARLPEAHVVARAFVDAFGMPYLVPQVVDWPGTIVAVNVGGALIPALLSIYLVVSEPPLFRGGGRDGDRGGRRAPSCDADPRRRHFGADRSGRRSSRRSRRSSCRAATPRRSPMSPARSAC